MSDFCPLIKAKCKEHGCKFFASVIGTHPQTGELVNHWDCVLVHMPMLTIENSQQQRQTGAAVESFRNEMVEGNQRATAILLGARQASAEGAPSRPAIDVPDDYKQDGRYR